MIDDEEDVWGFTFDTPNRNGVTGVWMSMPSYFVLRRKHNMMYCAMEALARRVRGDRTMDLYRHPLYYHRDGTPYLGSDEEATLAWAKDFGRTDRVVKRTNISGEIQVSTVWLGLDMNVIGSPPLIFETMVFGGPLNEEMDRYPSEEEARKGHDRMVGRVVEALETKR